ncbi:hypothetical protein [Vibrio vulnificus]|uniref:hypothetical protein n=1 Tax=Vibrio vulnificus TaxID=672 RepID=UPI003568490C
MKSTMIIVSHVVNDAVTHGFVPAAKAMDLHVVLITDHKLSHLEQASRDSHFNPDAILECDVFNPLEIIETITENELKLDAISATVINYKLPPPSARNFLVYRPKIGPSR